MVQRSYFIARPVPNVRTAPPLGTAVREDDDVSGRYWTGADISSVEL
jgi:hypothetical protein